METVLLIQTRASNGLVEVALVQEFFLMGLNVSSLVDAPPVPTSTTTFSEPCTRAWGAAEPGF